MIPEQKVDEAKDFFAKILTVFADTKIPFMVGGGFALKEHTGIERDLNDLDLFCKAGDYPKLLQKAKEAGFKIEVTDDRWIAKFIFKTFIVDIIFNHYLGLFPVNDCWFRNTKSAEILGIKANILPPEELIWSKAYRQDRTKYDGPDVYHLILKKGGEIDWKNLLNRMEAHWEVLFAHILNFRFIYPSNRNIIPKWLLEELVSRFITQMSTPPPQEKVSRGPLFSRSQYDVDIKQWGYEFYEES